MKNFKLILNLVMVVSSFMFFQCTSEYTPIAGIDGKDGVDGINGSDADAALCIQCHSSTHRDPIVNAYASSGHATGGSWRRGLSPGCAQCHSNEGYIDYLSGIYFETDTSGDSNEYLLDEAGVPVVDDNGTPGDPSDDFYVLNPDYNPDYGKALVDVNGDRIPMPNPAGYATVSPINCTGCHDAHRSFNFSVDGNDYALRNIDPVKLVLDPTVHIDLANSSDALGLSNACVTCHQPRPSYPIPTGTEDYTITSSRFGPHYGPQSTLFEGIMGANIAGSTAYPGTGANGDNGHRKGTSCIGCHMGESTVATEGGHTWAPSVDACVTCHTSMTVLPEATTSYATNFPILKQLLIDKGYILENNNVVPGTYPAKDAQVIWNYRTLYGDHSKGIHNPKYIDALLKNSIEYLQQ
ncbi:MAG TPA: hypothetical protein VIS27_03560 [Yeosuana sp.]